MKNKSSAAFRAGTHSTGLAEELKVEPSPGRDDVVKENQAKSVAEGCPRGASLRSKMVREAAWGNTAITKRTRAKGTREHVGRSCPQGCHWHSHFGWLEMNVGL